MRKFSAGGLIWSYSRAPHIASTGRLRVVEAALSLIPHPGDPGGAATFGSPAP